MTHPRVRPSGLAAATAAVVFLAVPHPAMASSARAAAPCINGETETRHKSAVDDGEIRWTDETTYDESRKWAISSWSYSGRKIKIMADGATTVNDLAFRDVDSGTGDAVAQYVWDDRIGATDIIRFNRKKMTGHSRDFQRAVGAHELGHALGLCHKSDAIASLMWTKVRDDPAITGPQPVDKDNYKKLWG
ncbi:matrixin family metalloprotease [Streptomyces sp. NBC_00190]|uniref:matrixin family metalloprotease n=1 Tax=unclassified Streptomyces TaxID=2593676 RepID=UPI002E28D9F4|nr:matrixin family metalloprotease [Streptomyces sp. NBC_00190]WSZ38540.1 matrixin family metalloprotease [Streptomyces sp. NBC_00868]